MILSIGIVLFGIFVITSTSDDSQSRFWESEGQKRQKYLEELSEKGIVYFDSIGPGKNIVDYRIQKITEFMLDSEQEEILREQQELISKKLIEPRLDYSIKRDKIIPMNSLSINHELNAVDIGIETTHLTEQNIPRYFEIIREVIGEKHNIVLFPSYGARPT